MLLALKCTLIPFVKKQLTYVYEEIFWVGRLWSSTLGLACWLPLRINEAFEMCIRRAAVQNKQDLPLRWRLLCRGATSSEPVYKRWYLATKTEDKCREEQKHRDG